jgi:hypothetical protein
MPLGCWIVLSMTMRYAHLSPAFLSTEVSLLDPPKPPSRSPEKGKKSKRARKGQSDSSDSESRSQVPEFVRLLWLDSNQQPSG